MRLYWYVLKDYVKYVIGTLVLCMFLFVLFDFIHKTTKYFTVYKPPADLVIKMYLYQLPVNAVQALPIAALLASVTTMVLLSRTNEVTAMRAAGMGPIRIALPLASGGLILSILAYVLGERVLPNAAKNLHHVQEIQIEGESEKEIAANARWQRRGSSIINFREFDLNTNRLLGLTIIDLRQNLRPVKLLEADSATFVPDAGIWDADNILLTYFNPNGTIDYTERRKSLSLKISVDPSKLMRDRRRPDEMSLQELKELILRGDRSGMDTLAYRVEMQVKLAYPLAALVVSLIGLQFGYKSERTTETARGVLIAFGIGISYWFILNAVKALGKRGDLHPFIAGWFANFFILGIVLLQAWKSRKDA